MAATTITQALAVALLRILRPLVRTLLRHGIGYGVFADIAKRVYVDVAREAEFQIPGRKPSKSHVAVITGLSRKEVLRVQRLTPPDDLGAAERYNRAARVVSGWVRDAEFHDEKGEPAILPVEGEGSTFTSLVKTFSGDAPVRAVQDELIRVGVAESLEGGRIRLLERSYIPRTGAVEKISILGSDVSDLIKTIDRNIKNQDEAIFQRKVAYDNLPAEALPELRTLTRDRAQELLEFFDKWLSERDRDVNPEVRGSGRKRAGIGIYYFEEDKDGEDRS